MHDNRTHHSAPSSTSDSSLTERSTVLSRFHLIWPSARCTSCRGSDRIFESYSESHSKSYSESYSLTRPGSQFELLVLKEKGKYEKNRLKESAGKEATSRGSPAVWKWLKRVALLATPGQLTAVTSDQSLRAKREWNTSTKQVQSKRKCSKLSNFRQKEFQRGSSVLLYTNLVHSENVILSLFALRVILVLIALKNPVFVYKVEPTR